MRCPLRVAGLVATAAASRPGNCTRHHTALSAYAQSQHPEDAQLLAVVVAEGIGWLPQGHGANLYLGHSAALQKNDPSTLVIDLVGVPDMAMAGMSGVLLGYGAG